jgi:hypothetical protein
MLRQKHHSATRWHCKLPGDNQNIFSIPAPHYCHQVKYLLGVSYKKQDTLQGELANIILQLQKGNFKWQEFVMGMAMLGFLISLKFIQKK